MGKGDDAVRRKKNKVERKKLKRANDSSTVSARIASIIAAKKRRKSGKRRTCQGMCFSLPTLDDPFNDRFDEKEITTRKTNETLPSRTDQKSSAKRMSAVTKKGSIIGKTVDIDDLERINEKMRTLKDEKKSVTQTNKMGKTKPVNSKSMEIQLNEKVSVHGHEKQAFESLGCPSKYFMLCLKEIEDALRQGGFYNSEESKPLFANPWGVEFWKCYSVGKDILEASGSSSDVEQIAWIVSAAADAISRREREGLLITGPFLLFLVPSKEKALQVRSLCKPLKGLGVHTVSLHPGASLDHQISGLQSCEPEFLVSTPERLLELLSLKAVDISVVSMLVIDGMESRSGGTYLDTLKSIRQAISGKPHTVFFNDTYSNTSIPAVQIMLRGSINRLSLNDFVASQGSCILQSLHVCSSKEEKIVKGMHVLDNLYCNQMLPQALKVLYIVGKNNNVQKLISAVKVKGYSTSSCSYLNMVEFESSPDSGGRVRPVVSIIDTDKIRSTDLEDYGVVIVPDFVLEIDDYVHILTKMARYTVHGELHSFLIKDDKPHAGPLIDILEKCGQAVPEALRELCQADDPC